ncbi:golgin-45-like isoform X2 [Xenia sp. Carnegie-2017]|uniref:golgin-45-like isoform X2 n=1 Tax=Xenia sp. Carnegie-2017 TaxID=2897299 RepID=UPI001F04E8F3|nr:golgin-45-like isoform X2 [Xenia sp. Carnegie-2017]
MESQSLSNDNTKLIKKFCKFDDVKNCSKSADGQKFLPNEGFSHLTSLSGNVSSTCVERDAECLDTHTLIKDLQTQNSKLTKEKEGLLNKLSVQNKVNADLKKLLVASVGEDIGLKLQEMSVDKAQFDTKFDHMERKCEELSEELSKVSIECDVWRSKFLASRMMTNGLTDVKTSLYVKNRNYRIALQNLLEEQSDIRQHLRATSRLLQGIHKSTNHNLYKTFSNNSWQQLQKSSIVELSHINFSLAEEICLSINPTYYYLSGDISSADEEMIPVANLTPAEQMVCHALKNDRQDDESIGLTINKLSRQYMGNSFASRFLTNNFRITFDCCERCTGPLKVV